MTWTATKEQGSGTLSYRLKILTLDLEFVTHASMITATRLGGLRVSGGKLKAIANIASGELDVSSLSVKVVDLDQETTALLATAPQGRTWLTANLTSSATSCSVRSTSSFATSGSFWLDSEAFSYTSKTGTSFTGLTRGALGSLAQAHYIDGGGSLRYPQVTDRPVTLAGRRAILYVYGENDDPLGDGTQIWRGIVSRPPTFSGATWSVSIDPITSVLARAVGADLGEPLSPRGIYYPWNRPFHLTLFLGATSVPGEASDSTGAQLRFPVAIGDTAFFETQEDFVTYLNTKIATATSGWATSVLAVGDGDAGWHLEATTDGTAKAVWCLGPGGVDPVFQYASDVDGSPVVEVGASTVYYFRGTAESLPGAGSVPRGYVGDQPEGTPAGIPSLASNFPARRIYVGGVASISSLVSAASIHFPAFGDDEERELTNSVGASVSPRYLIIRQNIFSRGFTSATLPEIRVGRTYAEDGSVWTAISAMVAAAPDELNAGSIPDLLSADFDSATWSELDESWQPRIVRARTFTSFADVPLVDLVREELKLAGYSLGISATGTLAIFRLRRPVATEAGAVTIDSVKVDKALPTWAPSDAGLVNTVIVKRGWVPLDDEYAAQTAIVRDVAAYGQSPRPRLIKIEPKSQCFPIETNAETVEVAARILGVLAFPYAMAPADVGVRHFDTALPGATAQVTTTLLPDTESGTRGVAALATLITGREYDIDSGRISLTLYAPQTRASGYCPSAKLTTSSDLGSDLWELTCDTYTFPSGTDASDWFAVNDEVRVARWDSTTAGDVDGVVTAAAGNVVTVQFGSTYTPGADSWFLSFRPSDKVLASQLRFVFLADSTGLIDASPDTDAWGFA